LVASENDLPQVIQQFDHGTSLLRRAVILKNEWDSPEITPETLIK
jgi:hypothetical protein